MSVAKPIGLALLAALALMLALAPSALAGVKADTVLTNGKIITVDAQDSVASAVAIKDGKVIAVGTRTQMRPFINSKTQVIDLHGRTATPGMIDSHVHFDGTRALYVLDVSVNAVHNIADVAAKVQEQCALLGPGAWVQGRGWATVHLAEQRPLYASDLDAVSPNNPVYLTETSGHQAVANSYALALAGITKDTPDPVGGIIDRDAQGNPTGLLKETAKDLVGSLIPPFTMDQRIEGTRYITKFANTLGITSILYPGITDAAWSAFNTVRNEGNMTVRAAMLWSTARDIAGSQALIDKVKPFTHPYAKDDDMLWSQGIKMSWGGVQDASTHWSWAEHWINFTAVNPGWYGLEGRWDKNIFRQQVKMYHDAGLQIQVHCCGDREQDWALESFMLAQESNPTYGLRHGIIHADIPTDWALENMPIWQRTLDYGYTYTNPVFMWWTEIIAAAMGPFMSLREMPLATYEATGNLYGFGSDYSVDPMDPKYAIWSAMTRDTLMGSFGAHPFGISQRIGVHEALKAHTRSNAYLLFMEDKLGSIEVGKYADIAVWDKDWYTATTDDIKDMNCEMTLLGGKIVYKADSTPVTVGKGL